MITADMSDLTLGLPLTFPAGNIWWCLFRLFLFIYIVEKNVRMAGTSTSLERKRANVMCMMEC